MASNHYGEFVKGSRKRKSQPTRNNREKRPAGKHSVLNDFESVFESSDSSPEVAIIDLSEPDVSSKGLPESRGRKDSGTVYDQHRSPGEFSLQNKMSSFKIPKKKSTFDLTADPRQERSVAPPTSHSGPAMPPRQFFMDIMKKAGRTLSSTSSVSTRASNQSVLSMSSSSGPSMVVSTQSTESGRAGVTESFRAHTLIRNSMESSLPPVVKNKSKSKPAQLNTQSRESKVQHQESDGHLGRTKFPSLEFKGQTGESKVHPTESKGQSHPSVDSEVGTSESKKEWDDRCLGLASANASFTTQSPQCSQDKDSIDLCSDSDQVISLDLDDDVLSDSSSNSLPAVSELINSGGKKASQGRERQAAKRLRLSTRKNAATTNDDVMTIDSQSDDDSPRRKTPPREVTHRINPTNGGGSPTRAPGTSPPQYRFMPPKPSPKKTVGFTSKAAEMCSLVTSCRTILDVVDAHTGSKKLSTEQDKNMSQHSNVFAKNPSARNHGDEVAGTLSAQQKKPPADRLPIASPTLSREAFTVEVSQTSKDTPAVSRAVENKRPGEPGSVFSQLERQPLKTTSQTGQTGRFYGNTSTSGSGLAQKLFSQYSTVDKDKRMSRRADSSTRGVLSSFGASTKVPRLLNLSTRYPMTRRMREFDDEDSVTLRVSSLQIGRLKPTKLFYVELNKETLCVKFDYNGLTETVKVPLGKCSAWQVHLGAEPYLICVFVTCAEAKSIAGNLSKKYLLDSDFFNPKSSDVSEQYILLTLEDAPTPQEISTLVEILENARTPEFQKIPFDQNMSTEEVLKLLKDTVPSKEVRSKGGPLSRQAVEKVLPTPQSAVSSRPVRRSQRTRKPPTKLDPSSITVEEEAPVVRSRPNVKLLTYNVPAGSRVNIEVSTHDVDTLTPGEYLNDKVVDFYLRYMWYEKLAEAFRPKVHIFSSFFHTRLKDASRDNKQLNTPERMHNRVKTWTRRVDLFDKEYIILPVCDRAHWFVAFVYRAGQFDPEWELAFKDQLKSRSREKNTRKSAKNRPVESPVVVMDTTTEEECTEPEDSEPLPPQPCTEEKEVKSVVLDAAKNDQVDGSLTVAGMDFIDVPCEDEDSDTTVEETFADSEPVGHRKEEKQEATKEEDVVVRDSPWPNHSEDSSTKKEGGEASVEGVASEGGVVTIESELSTEEVATMETNALNVIDSSTEEETPPLDHVSRPCVLVLDSLGVKRTGIVKTIRNYLTVEWKEKRSASQGELNFDLLPAKYPDIPLQNNSSDCGVFMLQYVESLLHRLEEGQFYPDTSEGWASYTQTGAKRQEIENLIMRLSKEQTNPMQTTDKAES